MSHSVAIIQKRLPAYRLPVFEALRQELARRDIELRLVYGVGSDEDARKRDAASLAWAHEIPTRRYSVGALELIWQPALPLLNDASLVIIPQEYALLLNYVLLAQRAAGRRKVAYWGHGLSPELRPGAAVREVWKRAFLRCVDWWYAYTDATRAYLISAAFPPDRITVVNNTIDTASVRQWAASLTREEIDARRRELDLPSDRIGVFCSSLYPGKRLPFVIEAARRVRASVPDFSLVIVGSGSEDRIAREASASTDWIRYVGRQDGRQQVLHLAIAKVLMLPYMAGLTIVDAFANGIPPVTIRDGNHGPEIAYLEDGVNGVMTDPSVEAYASAVVSVLRNEQQRATLIDGCRRTTARLSVESMSARFADGVERCIRA